MTRKIWEYSATFYLPSADKAAQAEHTRELAQLGADGWELAGITTLQTGLVQLYFKREKRPVKKRDWLE